MALPATATSLHLLIYCTVIVVSVDQNLEYTPTTPKDDENNVVKIPQQKRDGVEEEVLGPLRIWHIVFLVGLVIVIAVSIFCCCVEWRIPRTRQEIEETYRRRQLNQKYLHQLERTPDAILRNNNNNNNSHNNVDSNDDADRLRGPRHHKHHNDHQHHHQHQQQHHHQQQQQHPRTSIHHSQDQRQRRHPHHPQPHQQRHQHQQQQQQQHAVTSAGARRGVAVTETSARLARVARTQMFGVQTPFELSAITALQKQRQQSQTQRRET